jgi:F420-dependent oxidoreductase-like protein
MTAMSLASRSGDRFLLGLGNRGPQVFVGWHGIPFDRPVSRMRECIEATRIAMRGDRLIYNGRFYQLPRQGGEGKPLRSGAQPRTVPIYLATLSPKALEMTGELADGWLGTSFIPEQADVFFSHMQRGAEKAGRSLKEIDLQVGGGVAFSDDVDRLIAARKPGLAFTLGAMGSARHNFYNDAFKRGGFDEEARYVQRLWIEGRRDEAAAAVPDEMVLKSSMLGTGDMVLRRIRAYRDAGINSLRVDPAGGTLGQRLETLGRMLDLVRQVNEETVPVA